jgi:ADP-ribosyl-[dinitrogen reductase] hydrolase
MIEPRRVVGGLIGVAVGDALGVPVEFESREKRVEDPVTGMRSGGPHAQPAGTWSDDTSLTFATVETILEGYSLDRLGRSFVEWLQDGRWTARGEVFDVGSTTRAAIMRIMDGASPQESGSPLECDSGNGSLMRILPVALAYCRWSIPLMLERVHEASRVTHAHPRSLFACGLYSLAVRNLLFHRAPGAAYRYAMESARSYYKQGPWREEQHVFRSLLRGTLGEATPDRIHGSGYVVSTLEAAIWSLVTTRNFRDCVLKAVNLGEDTDTVAAVAGGMAGVTYGIDGIPAEWVDQIARRDELIAISEKFAKMISA